jgi:hypothetical protein
MMCDELKSVEFIRDDDLWEYFTTDGGTEIDSPAFRRHLDLCDSVGCPLCRLLDGLKWPENIYTADFCDYNAGGSRVHHMSSLVHLALQEENPVLLPDYHRVLGARKALHLALGKWLLQWPLVGETIDNFRKNNERDDLYLNPFNYMTACCGAVSKVVKEQPADPIVSALRRTHDEGMPEIRRLATQYRSAWQAFIAVVPPEFSRPC